MNPKLLHIRHKFRVFHPASAVGFRPQRDQIPQTYREYTSFSRRQSVLNFSPILRSTDYGSCEGEIQKALQSDTAFVGSTDSSLYVKIGADTFPVYYNQDDPEAKLP